MKWILIFGLVGLTLAAQTDKKPEVKEEKPVEENTEVKSADSRRHRGRHHEFEDAFYYQQQYVQPVAAAPVGYGAQPAAAAPAAYGAPQADTPAYGYPQQAAPQYVQAYPQYPMYAPLPPNYDVNYCSIHASYPMTGVRRHEDKSDSRDRDDDCDDESDSDEYSRKSRRCHRRRSHSRRNRWNRQTCRFTATFSQETCQTCCRVSSRNTNSDISTITGALFVFAPWDDRSDESRNLKREVQCVCCAPRVQPQSPSYPVPVSAAAAAPSPY